MREDYGSSARATPAFHRTKKTPMSSDWAFQLRRRHESRSHLGDRTAKAQLPDGTYRWVVLVILLSFGAAILIAGNAVRFL